MIKKKDKKRKKIVLLKQELVYIFKSFGSNFNSTGKNFIMKLAKDEKKTDYNILFFEINNKSVVKSVGFLEEIGTLYDLLVYLLDNSMRIVTSTQTQGDFLKAITILRIIISNIKTDITDQSKEEKKKIFAEQGNVLSSAQMLLIKRRELLDQSAKNNIISKNEKIFDAPKKIGKSTLKKPR